MQILTQPMSVMDLFTIGIGPSSSHTVGPMRAARLFAERMLARATPVAIRCDLYGSLALTGKGHATDRAVILGLSGHGPETIDPDAIAAIITEISERGSLPFGGADQVPFVPARDIVFNSSRTLTQHANAMRFTATFADGSQAEETYYSIGGGAIDREGESLPLSNRGEVLPFTSAAELLAIADANGLSIADIVRKNEAEWRDPALTDAFLFQVRAAMLACIDRGMTGEGILPGGLGVRRRARNLHEALLTKGSERDGAALFEWVSLWAMAVNEENAAGGRVVTAPTNGAAGILPAVLRYYEDFVPGADEQGSLDLLLTASAIGFLYKRRASISAAEMGCQGEVGVACSMAAAGLAAALGASNAQIENAAEIGMEHNLGLTCDPIAGLVQIPCIERNTMGAVKAINSAYLALNGDGSHVVSLDAVIETMRQTGRDMARQYKETSLGGLAVNVVEC